MADSPQAVTKQSPMQAGDRLHASSQPGLDAVTAGRGAPVMSALQRAADAMQSAVGLQAAVAASSPAVAVSLPAVAASLPAVASPQAAMGALVIFPS